MEILKVPHLPIDLRAGPPRSKGIHLSEIVHRMAIRSGRRNAEPEELSLDSAIENAPRNQVGEHARFCYLMIGFAWEQYLDHIADAQGIKRPGEWALDGVFMTPDGMELRNDCLVVHEFKFTSSSKPVTERPEWLWQIAGYVRAANMIYGLPSWCELHVYTLPVRGGEPSLVAYRIKFEQEELDSFWQAALRLKSVMETEKAQ